MKYTDSLNSDTFNMESFFPKLIATIMIEEHKNNTEYASKFAKDLQAILSIAENKIEKDSMPVYKAMIEAKWEYEDWKDINNRITPVGNLLLLPHFLTARKYTIWISKEEMKELYIPKRYWAD